MEENVLSFLKQKEPKICVLSTVDTANHPESAVVGYGIQDDLTLLFSTEEHTRKLQNIKTNPHVAVVIGWGLDEKNVQYEGLASLIFPGMELYQESEAFFYQMNPGALAFKTPTTVFITVTPTWIRLLDITKTPPVVEEKNMNREEGVNH